MTTVYEKVPFYRQAFMEKGLTPADIRSLADLPKLPFTVKRDFRDNYPLGLAAVPREQIVRLHASSGTTGKPTVVAYTADDIDLWTEVMARTLTTAGVGKDDVVHNAYGYGLFTGGLGFHYGAERVGATVIPISGGQTKRQIMLLQDLGSTVLCCTPSYALYLAEAAEEMGVSLRSTSLRIGIFGAEPWSQQMRQEVEAKTGFMALDIYGLSEIIGPGVSVECEHQAGLHIFEDHFLPEIVDPQTGEPLPYGERGELVFTTLTKEALPVIRYRTGDITTLHPEPCACGRTTVRMDKISGRTDDMLIVAVSMSSHRRSRPCCCGWKASSPTTRSSSIARARWMTWRYGSKYPTISLPTRSDVWKVWKTICATSCTTLLASRPGSNWWSLAPSSAAKGKPSGFSTGGMSITIHKGALL